ncbi:hypothetical protein BDV28DRAFT_74190 [Aspergillus coremiiformis]|uniref:Uncharacterized protein n=1 Tax=Aspergillus coremiiformis TaxID=138285 RepID=A0A5N6YTY8_9EURO|nr:hypothetical protein BDV28DRAFT_74190 [Aspergillus coremiiformis]
MNPIDLSSLEGPPIIHRPHSTNPSNLPSIRLDWSPVPLESFDGMPSRPPRPASADPVSSSRKKSPSTVSRVNWYRRDRSNIQRPERLTPGNGIHNDSAERRIDYSPMHRPSSHLGHSSPQSPCNSHIGLERHTRTQEVSPPHQIIWLDEQNTWVRADIAASMPPYQANGNLSPDGLNTRQVSTSTPSRSMDIYFSTNGDREAGIATSPPPPYERHIFDQPISSPRASPGEHSSQMTVHNSMWAAVAGRRAHRAHFGN